MGDIDSFFKTLIGQDPQQGAATVPPPQVPAITASIPPAAPAPVVPQQEGLATAIDPQQQLPAQTGGGWLSDPNKLEQLATMLLVFGQANPNGTAGALNSAAQAGMMVNAQQKDKAKADALDARNQQRENSKDALAAEASQASSESVRYSTQRKKETAKLEDAMNDERLKKLQEEVASAKTDREAKQAETAYRKAVTDLYPDLTKAQIAHLYAQTKHQNTSTKAENMPWGTDEHYAAWLAKMRPAFMETDPTNPLVQTFNAQAAEAVYNSVGKRRDSKGAAPTATSSSSSSSEKTVPQAEDKEPPLYSDEQWAAYAKAKNKTPAEVELGKKAMQQRHDEWKARQKK